MLLLKTRKPCCRRETARCRFKFSSIQRVQAANIGDSHYLRFDRTENSTILTVTDAESSILEPNNEWIGSPVSEIWPLHITRSAFKTPIMRQGEVVGNHRSYHWKVVSYARNRRNYNTYTFSRDNLIYNMRGISVGIHA